MMSIAHLGPPGTYAEQAALAYVKWVHQQTGQEALLCPYPSIARTLLAVAQGQAELAVVPVENSIEGSVTITLDMLWQLDKLHIQLALVLPIAHTLLSRAQSLESVQTVYSHPQALAQCQGWLEKFLPSVQLIPTNSTTEALQQLDQDWTAAAVSSLRASQLYNLPVLASQLNDYADNCTRFWVIGPTQSRSGSYNKPLAKTGFVYESATNREDFCQRFSHTTLAFGVPANAPGALVKPLQVFAERDINLSRIESRPTKRSLGDYLFFIDLEADINSAAVQSALKELTAYTEVLKIFGSYNFLSVTGH